MIRETSVYQGSTQKKKNKGRKGKATLNDLPPKTVMKFGAFLVPNVKAYVGTLPAWAEPDLKFLQQLWDDLYIDIECGWEKDDPVHSLVCLCCHKIVLLTYTLLAWLSP
jgi:hypothetical protein